MLSHFMRLNFKTQFHDFTVDNFCYKLFVGINDLINVFQIIINKIKLRMEQWFKRSCLAVSYCPEGCVFHSHVGQYFE